MNENVLDYFGEKLMLCVRDETIIKWDMILDGKMKGITAQQVSEKMINFNREQIEVLKWLIPKIVDTNIHKFLAMLEEHNEIKVEIYDGQNNNNINEISDGLAGELYTEDGWIKRFSEKRYDGI
ncbi:hypothetical protein [Clostridium sp.]|uniref:hypothetical protein n=1 Tax=Clostridium sp. TaxID=1506 RepID=UPI00262DD659|nr:hypothetical protein [Clostridium sp.]